MPGSMQPLNWLSGKRWARSTSKALANLVKVQQRMEVVKESIRVNVWMHWPPKFYQRCQVIWRKLPNPWLTRHCKSMSILRPLNDNLMLARNKLAPNIKSKSHVRHLPQRPIVKLRFDGKSPTRPQETLAAITTKILGFDHVFKVDSKQL